MAFLSSAICLKTANSIRTRQDMKAVPVAVHLMGIKIKIL
jgi:hypothetical protein